MLENREFKNINELVKYIFEKGMPKKTVNKEQIDYILQIGDEVIAESGIEDINGIIIAEVELYDCYQIKISELNTVYAPEYKVKVVKKKSHIEKEPKFKKLKEEIDTTKFKYSNLADELNTVEDKLDNLLKKLKKLEE